MNKTAYRLFLAIVAVLLFHSCSSNELPDGGDGERIPLTFRVAISADISAGARGTLSDVSSHSLGSGVGVFVVGSEQYEDLKKGVLGKTYPYGYANVKYTYDSNGGVLQKAEGAEQIYCLSSREFAVFAYAPYEKEMTLEKLLTGKGGVSVSTDQSAEADVEASDFMLGTPSGSNPLVVSGADVAGSSVVSLDFRHQRSRIVLEMTPDWIYEALGGGAGAGLSISSLKVYATNVIASYGNGVCYSLSAEDMKNFVYGGTAIDGEILMAAFSGVDVTKDGETLTMETDGDVVTRLTSTAIVFPFSMSSGAELFRIEYDVEEDGSPVEKEVLLRVKSELEAGMGTSIIFRVGQKQSDNIYIESSGSASPAI